MKERRELEARKHREEQQQRQLMKANQCLRDDWTVESDAEFYEDPDQSYFTDIY
jgi:regulator of sirC expression with transglutaminase-like and TPR domain